MTARVVAGQSIEGNAGNIVCDLDGVLYLGDTGVPGAGEALATLDQRGYRIVLATNNATRTPEATAAKVERLTGYATDRVVTSAQSAAHLLAPDRPHCLVVGGEGIHRALAGEEIPVTDEWREAGAVVVGLDVDLTYERLKRAVLAVRNGARLVATNTDETFPTPEGLWPGAGSLVAAIAAGGGRPPEVSGKPHAPMRALVRERLRPGPTWVIGDRPETDLVMGGEEGWGRILALSGVLAQAPSEGHDAVVADIAELPALLP